MGFIVFGDSGVFCGFWRGKFLLRWKKVRSILIKMKIYVFKNCMRMFIVVWFMIVKN